MDTIWYENPSKWEVIGRCGGDEKTNDHTEPTKVKHYFFIKYLVFEIQCNTTITIFFI